MRFASSLGLIFSLWSLSAWAQQNSVYLDHLYINTPVARALTQLSQRGVAFDKFSHSALVDELKANRSDPPLNKIVNRFVGLDSTQRRKARRGEYNLLPQIDLEQNAQVRDYLEQTPPPSSAFSQHQAADLLRVLKSQYVVKNRRDFDLRKAGNYFCYAKAVLAHVLSLYFNEQVPIIKLAVVGDLSSGIPFVPKFWFHIATAVAASEGGWWVIDARYSRPLKSSEWISRTQSFYRATQNSRVVVLAADTLSPSGEVYAHAALLPETALYLSDFFLRNPQIEEKLGTHVARDLNR